MKLSNFLLGNFLLLFTFTANAEPPEEYPDSKNLIMTNEIVVCDDIADWQVFWKEQENCSLQNGLKSLRSVFNKKFDAVQFDTTSHPFNVIHQSFKVAREYRQCSLEFCNSFRQNCNTDNINGNLNAFEGCKSRQNSLQKIVNIKAEIIGRNNVRQKSRSIVVDKINFIFDRWDELILNRLVDINNLFNQFKNKIPNFVHDPVG